MGGGNNYINNILHSTINAGGYYASINTGDGDNLVSITTSDGNNTIITGNGNDTILGNADGNLFVYAGGNDLLGESAVGSSISLATDGANNITDISSIVYDSIGTAVLTFNNDAGKTLTLQNAAGLTFVINNTARIFGENAVFSTDQKSVTLTSAYTGDIDASLYTNFDASALDWKVVLLGNVLANNLVGGSGNDSLFGNAGNDTLTGGDGSDVFIYTAGNDVITDFADDDLLKISETFSGTYNESANTVAFKVGSTASTITLKNFTATTFNVNGTAYQISNSEFVKK